MELESPADAWYVWIGVALVSVGVAGVVVTLPPEPPPDASAAANTADRVAASEYGTSASVDHDAEYVQLGTRRVALRNDGGTDHASVVFRSLTPVSAAEGKTREAGEAILSGGDPQRVVEERAGFGSEAQLCDAFRNLRLEVDREGAEWRRADGPLRVRSVQIADETVVLVGT